MATIFGGSRLANLREKRVSGDEAMLQKHYNLKLSMPQQSEEKISYQPSSKTNLNRTQTRLLKGRIDRPSLQTQDPPFRNQNTNEPLMETLSRPKLVLPESKEQLKLVINDDKPIPEERRPSVDAPMRTTQKRILIAKEPQKQIERPKEKQEEKRHIQPKVQPKQPNVDIEPQKMKIPLEQKLIRQQDVEQSLPQNECDLVECPEGCGRKFNAKALEKHAKACKLVFMSKRKEFNSQAKRFVNKQHANLAKQQKNKEKAKPKGKGFEKTSDNWKAASEDFRAAIKAIKKDEAQGQDEEKEESEVKMVKCKFCEKGYAEIFLEKHEETCGKRHQPQKKKVVKKKI